MLESGHRPHQCHVATWRCAHHTPVSGGVTFAESPRPPPRYCLHSGQHGFPRHGKPASARASPVRPPGIEKLRVRALERCALQSPPPHGSVLLEGEYGNAGITHTPKKRQMFESIQRPPKARELVVSSGPRGLFPAPPSFLTFLLKKSN